MSTIKMPNLSDREAEILYATVESFIETNVPVSSTYLKKKYGFSISPATIRATLANLERKGYLKHLHTSSGRVPTDFGYRHYVDSVQIRSGSNTVILEKIEKNLITIASNVDELLNATAMMLAKISHLFGIVWVAKCEESILSDIELVLLQSKRVMLILATESGLVRSIVLNLDVNVESRHLELITRILKDRLVGLPLKKIQASIQDRLRDTEIYNHEIVQILLDHPEDNFSIEQNKLIYTSSPNEILKQPEFQNLDSYRRLLPALEKQYLTKVFNQDLVEQPPWIYIGYEIQDQHLKECSILTTSFISGGIEGQLGIVGPRRLPYSSIKLLLNHFAEVLPSVL